MSWQVEIPIIVRTLINDWSDPPQFSEDRLLQVISVAAKYVQFDVSLDYEYTISAADTSITPDPTTNKDDIFISLISLKAACIIDQSSLRTKAALEGIKTVLGPASLTVQGNLDGWKTIVEKGPCATYDELTSHWNVQNASAVKAILSPFVGNNFDPRMISTDNAYYRRMYS
jgi:hypothetical protein